MKNYLITVNGQTYQVQVEEVGGFAAQSPITSAPHGFVPTATVPAPSFAPAAPAQAPAASAPVSAPAAQAEPIAPSTPAAQGSIDVISPMPGKILGIKASVGQSVKAGDPIVILEAMKMENEIVAPTDGVIASINVSNGESVEVSQVLATMN